MFQFTKRFVLLRLELRDSGGFLEYHAAIIRLAGKNLCDVSLSHDAVAGTADPRPHK
jgi:hypothetical protein